jgi:uncharacterized RDD family membrane protein YckC
MAIFEPSVQPLTATMRPVEIVASSYDSGIVVRRWGATLIDFLLLGGIVWGAFSLPADAVAPAVLVSFFVLLAYYLGLEWRFGATLGKLICQLRVVDIDGKRPSFQQVGIRTLLRLIEVNPMVFGGIPAGIVVLSSNRRQRLGDMAAKTYVLTTSDLQALRTPESVAGLLATAAVAAGPRLGVANLPTAPPDAHDDPLRMLLPVGRSGLAIAAGYLGLLSPLLLPAPFALFAGIRAVIDLKRHPEKIGMGRAVFGIVMGGLFTLAGSHS